MKSKKLKLKIKIKMKKMIYYKNILNLFLVTLILFSVSSVFAIETYNGGDEFSVSIDSLRKSTYNDEIKLSYIFTLKNSQLKNQEFFINIEPKSGWTINYEDNFILLPNQSKNVVIDFIANSDFDYTSDVVSSDVIKISQRANYTGNFEFPVKIKGESELITLKFNLEILKKEILPVEYITTISTETLSPLSPLKYTIKADNLKEDQNVNIIVEFEGKILKNFNEIFKKENYYKIFSLDIPTNISPGKYNVKIIIKYSNFEGKSTSWEKSALVEVSKYENLKVEEKFEKSLVKDKFIINIKNNGNIKSKYQKDIKIGFFKSFFFGSNAQYQNTNNGIIFNIELEKGEEFRLEYYFNYLPIYIISVILIIFGIYIFYRKNSNPLEIETKIYDIRNVAHEGVKSLKVRIGFENIKENEIENIQVIFRMPSYLNIKENSFLLAEPKKVLKGSSQYKMTWEFKRFEKNDTRILGFTLINPRGVLGDIRLPDLEFELKIRGKIRKYYKSFPIIKG